MESLSGSLGSGSTTGSIICPSMPSERTMAGILYSSPRSNAVEMMSTVSWTVDGANTSMWKSPCAVDFVA